jgi:nucleotide-binding universal stress UspA family protein
MSDEEKKNFDVSHQKVARDYLDDIASRLASGGASVEKVVLAGRASEELSDYAKKNNIDLVVISTHGRSGVSRWVMGSVADRLLRSTSAPVLMIRAPGCAPAS